MDLQQLAPLVGFCIVATITPGPNNVMLLTSGVNFGYLRTVPHMLGVTLGFVVMIAAIGAGLSGVLDAWPPAWTILKAVSVAFLLYLAWKFAHAAPPVSDALPDDAQAQRPMSFFQAVAFQWVNPKAWTMGLSALAVYAPDRSLGAVLWVAMVFAVVALPSNSIWMVAGRPLRRWLAVPGRLRRFNWTMAALLLLTLVPILLG